MLGTSASSASRLCPGPTMPSTGRATWSAYGGSRPPFSNSACPRSRVARCPCARRRSLCVFAFRGPFVEQPDRLRPDRGFGELRRGRLRRNQAGGRRRLRRRPPPNPLPAPSGLTPPTRAADRRTRPTLAATDRSARPPADPPLATRRPARRDPPRPAHSAIPPSRIPAGQTPRRDQVPGLQAPAGPRPRRPAGGERGDVGPGPVHRNDPCRPGVETPRRPRLGRRPGPLRRDPRAVATSRPTPTPSTPSSSTTPFPTSNTSPARMATSPPRSARRPGTSRSTTAGASTPSAPRSTSTSPTIPWRPSSSRRCSRRPTGSTPPPACRWPT